MTMPSLSVRLMRAADIDAITNYWLRADAGFLQGMGVDLQRLPTEAQLCQMLEQQLQLPLTERQSFCVIWELEGRAVGHCNTNPIAFGQEAAMHLHLWDKSLRRQGLGLQWLRMSIPLFFEHLKLQKLYSEPYARNAAPHKALEQAGFSFIKAYETTPGSLSFPQLVRRWEMSRQDFLQL